MITVDEMVESGKCPCPICSSQDNEEGSLEKEKLKELDEVCDLFSNEIIDLFIENPNKYLLQDENKENTVE